jgi:hypothetical protein
VLRYPRTMQGCCHDKVAEGRRVGESWDIDEGYYDQPAAEVGWRSTSDFEYREFERELIRARTTKGRVRASRREDGPPT